MTALVEELVRFVEETVGTNNAFMRSWLRRWAAMRAEAQWRGDEEG